MLRNTVLYHRFWYVKKRNAVRARIVFRLGAIIIILASVFSYASKILLPAMFSQLELGARAVVEQAAGAAVGEILSERSKRTAAALDEAEIAELTGEIARRVEEKLSAPASKELAVPLGTFFGKTLLSSAGPRIKAVLDNAGPVKAEIKPGSAGPGQDFGSYSKYIVIKARVVIRVEALSRAAEVTASATLTY